MKEQPPLGWVETTLGQICHIRSGNSSLIKGRMFSEPTPELVPAFSASGQDVWCEHAEYHGPGIVVSAVGARCGKAFLAGGSWTAIANTQVARPMNGINVKFLWYLLNDEDFWTKGGSAQPFVKVKPSLEIAVLLPPIAEQERIVDAIEEHFSHIDTVESTAQTALAKLDTLRRTVLTAAFSGRLVDQDPDDEPASVLLERIAAERPQRRTRHAAQRASQRPSPMIEVLPSGWASSVVGDIFEIVGGSTPRTDNPDYWGGDIPWLTPDDLSQHNGIFVGEGRRSITEAGLKSSSTHMLPENSVLFSSRAPIGYVAIASNPLCTNQGFKNLIPPEKILPKYVYWYLRHSVPEIRDMGSGTTFKEISKKRMAVVPFMLAPANEQKRIVTAIEEHLSRIDAAKTSLESCLQRCGVLRRSVLAAAFSGRLVDQDPDDEPASVLLERIAAEQPKRRIRRKSA